MVAIGQQPNRQQKSDNHQRSSGSQLEVNLPAHVTFHFIIVLQPTA